MTWKLSRLALCTAVVVAALTAAATAAPMRLGTNTNLRMGPGTNFGVIVTVPAGAIVNVIRCTALWCNVLWRGRPGYMIARNIVRPRPVIVGPRPVVVAPAPPVVVVAPPVYGPYYGPGFYGPRVIVGPRPWRRWGW
jgi:uncharacterized protein YraI